MMKKKIIIATTIVILIVLGGILYITNTKKNSYVCLVAKVPSGEKIKEYVLGECTTSNKLPKGVITKKDDVTYKCLKEGIVKDKKDFIYNSDLETCYEDRVTETDIPLLASLTVLGYMENFEDEEIYYDLYVKNNKLYARNNKTNEERVIFDEKEVFAIATRNYCCTGNQRLLILTLAGEVYISVKDVRYDFTFDSDFPFAKTNGNNIKYFKLIPENDDDLVKKLYGITSDGKEVLIEEPE